MRRRLNACALLLFTCGALGMFTSGGIASTAGVDLSIPPVAPADVPAMYRPLIGTSTCGAKIYYIEPDTARSPRVSARAKAQRSHQDRRGTRSK